MNLAIYSSIGLRDGLDKRDEFRGVSQFGQDKQFGSGPWIEDYSDSSKMDLNSTDGDSEDGNEDVDASVMLERAKQSLEELRLNDAEVEFLRASAALQEKEKEEDCRRAMVETYLGLAEVCTRKSRAFRQSPLEWFWLCVHASSLLSEVVDLCAAGLSTETDNQSGEWLAAQGKFAAGRAQNLVDVLGRTLFNWLKDDWRLVDPNHITNLLHSRTPLTPLSRYPLSSPTAPGGGPKPYQSGFLNHAFSIESLHDAPSLMRVGWGGGGYSPSAKVNWFKRLQKYCRRRTESRSVKEITTEIFSMTEESKTDDHENEQKLEFDTISEETDLDLARERGSSDKQNSEADRLETVLKDIEEEEEEIFSEDTYDIAQVNEKSRTDSLVKEHSLTYELASSEVDTAGWEFFLENRKNCVVQSVIECASGASTTHSGEVKGDEHTTVIVETVDAADEQVGRDRQVPNGTISPETFEEETKKEQRKEIFTPLGEKFLRLTIAKSFQVVAQSLIEAEEYQQAENMCEEVLQIVDEIQDGTVKLLRFSALLLQSIGLLCFRQGNRYNGMKNLEKALRIYRDLQDYEAHKEVAVVLIDLGNAYANDLNDESLYDKVISAMCEFFERDAADEESTGTTTPEKPVECPEEIELQKRVAEAVTCYKEALAVLENHEENQKQVIAMAMRKLGDCHFVQKQYSDALDWYERALQLHRSSGFHGRDSVLENAHILSMLGVSTFMLHVYPRSSHVFELALHMVKHAHGLTFNTFMHCLVLSLLGISYYKMKAYHKCVSMCSRAFETFWNIHEEKIADLPQQRFWLVCQNLYILGNTYNVLNMHHKAIKFLEIGRAFMRESQVGEKRQHMRILQILGDCYFAQYDYKTALSFYNEALDIGDKVSSSMESEALERLGLTTSASSSMTASSSAGENLDMALHNQLLSRSADAHISMKQYQNAVTYLEQARDIQDVLEDDIKGDLVSTLHQLGQMHSMAGDIDKAIESYKESLEVFRELHNGQLAPEMCITLGNLATMCYVKACICEDLDSELEMILSAEQYFQAALNEELIASVSVKYANFLYSQANYDDAVMYLEDLYKKQMLADQQACFYSRDQCIHRTDSDSSGEGENLGLKEGVTIAKEQDYEMDAGLFFSRPHSSHIVYGGLERVTLPEPLQEEVDVQEEAIMPTSVLAFYILVLSYKMQGKLRRAEEALVSLMGEVYSRDIPFLFSVLGYAFMELGLFKEAAREFKMAYTLDQEYNLALDNYCLCLAVNAYNVLERAFASIFVHCGIWNEEHKINQKVASLQAYMY
ncbi:tetratricopeptide repeat protein 28 [Plakobranchus ocellatus]|uniref:Tetratricopeptide repeat protein 28 n=1 Tax=Plakobranchus ocellatus TaxID=259542 RepID=A0AAV4AEA9_9GAST|nr:tetratricopeptide repeat protein 28 [Plakobranchus ocellatus]